LPPEVAEDGVATRGRGVSGGGVVRVDFRGEYQLAAGTGTTRASERAGDEAREEGGDQWSWRGLGAGACVYSLNAWRLVAGGEEGRWSPHRFRLGRTITFGGFLWPDERFFDSVGVETCSDGCLAFGLGREGDWLLDWRPFCLVGFWGVGCFDLATAMALGSVGVDAGRGEGGARIGGVVESAGNRARGVPRFGVTILGVVVVSISEVVVVAGGLVVVFKWSVNNT